MTSENKENKDFALGADHWPLLWNSSPRTSWSRDSIPLSIKEHTSPCQNGRGELCLGYEILWKKNSDYGHVTFRTCPSRGDIWIYVANAESENKTQRINFNTWQVGVFDFANAQRFDFDANESLGCPARTFISVPRQFKK